MGALIHLKSHKSICLPTPCREFITILHIFSPKLSSIPYGNAMRCKKIFIKELWGQVENLPNINFIIAVDFASGRTDSRELSTWQQWA